MLSKNFDFISNLNLFNIVAWNSFYFLILRLKNDESLKWKGNNYFVWNFCSKMIAIIIWGQNRFSRQQPYSYSLIAKFEFELNFIWEPSNLIYNALVYFSPYLLTTQKNFKNQNLKKTFHRFPKNALKMQTIRSILTFPNWHTVAYFFVLWPYKWREQWIKLKYFSQMKFDLARAT